MDAAAGQDLGEESESRKGKATVISGDSGSLVGNGALNMTCEDSQRISKEIEDLRAQIDKDVKEFGYCVANKKLRVELALKVKEIQCLRKQNEEIQAKYDGMIKSNGDLQAKTDGLAKHNEELQAKNDRLVKEYEEPVCSVPTVSVSAGTAPMAVDTPCPAAVEDASVGPSGGTAELGGGFPPPELAPSSSGICAAISGETSEEALWDEMQSNLASTATGLRALADDLKARVAEISNGFQAQVTALQKDKSAALKEKLEAEAVCSSLSAKVTRLQVETKKQEESMATMAQRTKGLEAAAAALNKSAEEQAAQLQERGAELETKAAKHRETTWKYEALRDAAIAVLEQFGLPLCASPRGAPARPLAGGGFLQGVAGVGRAPRVQEQEGLRSPCACAAVLLDPLLTPDS